MSTRKTLLDTNSEWSQEQLAQLMENQGYTPHLYFRDIPIPQWVKFALGDPMKRTIMNDPIKSAKKLYYALLVVGLNVINVVVQLFRFLHHK